MSRGAPSLSTTEADPREQRRDAASGDGPDMAVGEV